MSIERIKNLKEVPISKINFSDKTFMNRNQRLFKEEALKELIESLKKDGQQVPVELKIKPNGRYQIISGFRRCNALKMIDTKNKVLAFIHPSDEEDFSLHRISLLENLQREDLSEWEKIAMAAKLKEQGMPKKDLASSFGVGIRSIESYIRIANKASKELREAIEEGIMTLQMAAPLINQDKKTINEAITEARLGKLTVKQAKKLVGKRTAVAKPINQIKRFRSGFNLKVRFRMDYDEVTKEDIKNNILVALNLLEGKIKQEKPNN